jgi:hypothetical protein
VTLGGRRCDIKSFLFLDEAKIERARCDPQFILGESALVPTNQLASDHVNDRDLYLFAFVHALATYDCDELKQATDTEQPTYLIYPLPVAWAQPNPWQSLGRLVLKTDLPVPVELELGGQDRARGFQTEKLTLPPHIRQQVKNNYYSLAYLHLPALPLGQIKIHSARLAQTLVIHPAAWINIWIYGMEIILAGYMTCGEFRRRAREFPRGPDVPPSPRARSRNRFVPVRQLHPLSTLFTRVKAWEEYKSGKHETRRVD